MRAPRQGTETFSQSHPWWTRADHDALLTLARRVPHATVLEFGPGVSTLAWLEAGARWVDTFEDREDWYDFHRVMIQPHAATIHQHLYRRRDPLVLPQIRLARYELAFVDGPRWVHDRLPEMIYARDHARAVAVHDFWYPEIRQLVSDVFSSGGWTAEQFVANDGALALLTRR